MEKLKNTKVNEVLIILSFVLNILIFAPIEMFYNNKSELWFSLGNMLPTIAVLSIIVLSILLLLMKLLKNNAKSIYITILFLINLGLYIQGNFLNFGYDTVDGEAMQWNSMVLKGIINTAVWLVIIFLPLIYKKRKGKENFKLLTMLISVFIMLIEIITLIIVILTNTEEGQKINGLNNNNIFNLSDKENIVVIMSDTFEATYMNQILEDYPEYKEKLKDFIYFDNCTGVSFYTYSSMPSLLTGVECKVGNSLSENMDYCFENTQLYDILKQNGFQSELYVESILTPGTNSDEIYNLNTVKDIELTQKTKTKITKKVYKYVLYRYLPHFLKSNFEITKTEFNQIKGEDKSIEYKEKNYYLDDVAFNSSLELGGITANSSKKTFKFYQTYGIHVPYNTTAEIEYNNTKEYLQKDVKERRTEETLATLNILCNYVEELKKAGIYDQTTIIFLADHGYENRFYTNLMVKKENTNCEFEISSAPVSLKDDLIPTILNIATNSKDYGKDFFDYEEDEERTRQVYDYTYESNKSVINKEQYKIFSEMVFQTDSLASDNESFYKVSEEYYNKKKELTEKYEFDTQIKIEDVEKSNSLNIVGFNLERINIKVGAGWNISDNAYIEVNKQKSNSDVILELNLKQIYNNEQTVNFRINGETIHTCVVRQDEDNKIEVKIPKKIWNENEIIRIEMDFPNAVLGKKHKTMMTAIQISSIKFLN